MTQIAISTGYSDLNALRELSATIGGNPLLVQASSGNTSIKIDDVLWIKASGKWLVQADTEDFLVPVSLSRARRCLQENAPIPETEMTVPGRLSASIETAMHAVLPQKVVVHAHSVNTIAWAVRDDGPRQLRLRLSSLHWQWIPYTPSGILLAANIQDILSRFPETNVLILGNHGLVVCGDTCRSAENLLANVEDCLSVEPRPAPQAHPASLEQALEGSSWCLPERASVHALATDQASQRILDGGVLYPCQAIFLPGTTPFQRTQTARLTPHMLDGHGVLCSRDMTRADHEMLTGLTNIVQRVDPSAPLRYLTPSEVHHVLNGGGENYSKSGRHQLPSLQPVIELCATHQQ